MRKATAALLLGMLACGAHAEVTDAAANGFTTVNEVVVEGTRVAAWQAALDVAKWWSSDHTISGDAARLSIQPGLPGCFCEDLGDGAGVVHLVVTSIMPTTMLRLTGALGPLGLMGVDGNMTWEFEDADKGVRIRFTYAIGGYMNGGLDQIAGGVDAVLGEALVRLQRYVESGDPEGTIVD